MATIGWSQERTDEVLVPVIKDMNRRENEGTQANITQFFGGGVGVGSKSRSGGGNNTFAPRRRVEGKSQRMETALSRLHQQARNRTIGEGRRIPRLKWSRQLLRTEASMGMKQMPRHRRHSHREEREQRSVPLLT